MHARTRILAILGHKGGTGRTTTAINLAEAARLAGLDVALIDGDRHQLSAHQCLTGIRRDDAPPIHSVALSRVTTPLGVADHLRDLRRALVACGAVDLVLIDGPPGNEAFVLAASQVADAVLLVAQPSPLDLTALEYTARLVAEVASRRDIPVGAVLTRCARDAMLRTAVHVIAQYPVVRLCPHQFHDRLAYKRAYACGLGVVAYEPGGKAAVETLAVWRFAHGLIQGEKNVHHVHTIG